MLENRVTHYRSLLFEELAQRRKKNPLYSLRAFARDLQVSTTALSDVLAQKRNFSKKSALKVAARLGLSEGDSQQLLNEVAVSRMRANLSEPVSRCYDFRPVDEKTFSLISDWYYLAILNLAKLQGNHASAEWIAGRLRIDTNDAKCALDRLQRMGLIQISSGKLHRTTLPLSSESETPSGAIRKFHAQALSLAAESLERDSIEKREFTTAMVAVDPERLPAVKEMVYEFVRKVTAFLDSEDTGHRKEVYALAAQFFPVTRLEKNAH